MYSSSSRANDCIQLLPPFPLTLSFTCPFTPITLSSLSSFASGRRRALAISVEVYRTLYVLHSCLCSDDHKTFTAKL